MVVDTYGAFVFFLFMYLWLVYDNGVQVYTSKSV